MYSDFRIVSAPVAVELDCPFCEAEIHIPWDKVGKPESWSDPWDDIECPECGKTIRLGDWEYD